MGHIRGLLCEQLEEETPSNLTKTHRTRPSGKDGFCGCGEQHDEEMIECMSGKVCGGWVHFSCAGIDFENYKADEKDNFICKWCRAAGVTVGVKKEVASGSTSARTSRTSSMEEERGEGRSERGSRTRGRAKKDGMFTLRHTNMMIR